VACSAFMSTPLIGFQRPTSATSTYAVTTRPRVGPVPLRMSSETPAEGEPAAEVTNATAEEEGDAVSTSEGAPPPPAPKKSAPKKKAAAAGPSLGFSGLPADFARPEAAAYASEPTEQTFLGMRGPRAPGHREKFNTQHTATMLALAALLWQPVSQAGMYHMGPDGSLSKSSFNQWEVPGFGNAKRVPTIESLFPFAKNGFDASPALFGPKSRIVVEDPREGCGAYDNTGKCHTFLDEIGDALKKTPETLPRSEAKPTYSFPWMYEHAAWKK